MQPSDNRLKLYEPVPQLQDMAAFKVAVNLTMNYVNDAIITGNVVRGGKACNLTLFYWRRNEIYKTKPDDLIIPRTLEAMVKKYVIDCCDEIQQWLYFYDRVSPSFKISTVAVMREFLPNIVWKSNGKIDHLHSAINFLNNARLRGTVKFRLMCEFCMEDEIRNAWFELRNRSFVETLQFWREPLSVYWCCVMTGDFSKITHINDTYSVEKRLLLNLDGKSAYFPVVEYFFNRLDVDDRIEVGAALMRRWCGWTRLLISKYTEDEQYRLFSTSDNVVDVFGAYICDKSYEYLDDALKTWIHIKNLVNGDQYVKILRGMSRWRTSSSIRDELYEFLKDFWHTTPQNLKEYVFQFEEDEFLSRFIIYPYGDDVFNDYDELVLRDDRILIAVLSEANLEYRKRFWRRHWTMIVYRSQPSRLREILNLCISNNATAAFKKDAMSSPIVRKYLEELMKKGKFLVLNEFLEMFIDGGQRKIDDAKRELFKETNVSNIMHVAVAGCENTEEGVTALIEFLRVVFGTDLKGVAKFKKQMILEYFKDTIMYQRWYSISKIIYVSDHVCEPAMLNEVKNEILKECKILLFTKNGDQYSKRSEWNMVLLWCLGGQQEVEEFKASCKDLFLPSEERTKRRKMC